MLGGKSRMRPLLLLAALVAIAALPPPLCASPSNTEVARYAAPMLEDNYPQNGPGAALVVARGMGEVEHATLLTADDLFDIASITKQFAAAGLLNHTLGVKDYSDALDAGSKPLTLAQVIGSFRNEKPDFAPGEG